MVLRWVGGKSRIVNDIRAQFPEQYDRYFEPFAGSAALYFSGVAAPSVLSDACRPLINFYKALRDNPEKLWSDFAAIEQSERGYYESREYLNATGDPASFLHCNVFGYCGLWRVNKDGKYNVPYGFTKHGKVPSREDLLEASARLRNCTLLSGDAETVLAGSQVRPGDLVYLDPPYPKTYGNYTSREFDHLGFVDFATRLPCRVIISYPMWAAEEMFPTWSRTPIDLHQALRKGSHRHSRQEAILRNF